MMHKSEAADTNTFQFIRTFKAPLPDSGAFQT